MKQMDIMQRIEMLQEQLEELKAQIKSNKKPEKPKLFDDRAASYTLDEIDTFVRKHFHPAEFDVRAFGEYAYNGIYLGEDDEGCAWEIVKDSQDMWVLILKANK